MTNERDYICHWQLPRALDWELRAEGPRDAAVRFVLLWGKRHADDRVLAGQTIVVTDVETGNQSEWRVDLDAGGARVTEVTS